MNQQPPSYTVSQTAGVVQKTREQPTGQAGRRQTEDELLNVPGFFPGDPIEQIVPADEKVLYIGRVTEPEEMGKIACWTTVLPWIVYPLSWVPCILCAPCTYLTRRGHMEHFQKQLLVLTDKKLYMWDGSYQPHPCFNMHTAEKIKAVPLEEVEDVVVGNTDADGNGQLRGCCGGCFLHIPLLHVKTVNVNNHLKMRDVQDGHQFAEAILSARETLLANTRDGTVAPSAVTHKRIQCSYDGKVKIVLAAPSWIATLASVRSKFGISASRTIELCLTNGMVPVSAYEELNIDDSITVVVK